MDGDNFSEWSVTEFLTICQQDHLPLLKTGLILVILVFPSRSVILKAYIILVILVLIPMLDGPILLLMLFGLVYHRVAALLHSHMLLFFYGLLLFHGLYAVVWMGLLRHQGGSTSLTQTVFHSCGFVVWCLSLKGAFWVAFGK